MDRLTLPCRPKTAEREKCLPAGDGLPLWSTLPLDAKFPMVPNNPKGSIVLCTTKLGQPKHKTKQDFDFDLTDPWGHVISNEYLPLHDPHLKALFNSAKMKRHLIRKQFITRDGKVICNLKEFNQYRQYLRRICLMEIARERTLQDEEERLLREELMSTTKAEMEKTDERVNTVRQRLMDIREKTRKNLEIVIQNKAERLKKRLDEVAAASSLKEARRREEDKRKQMALFEHQQKIRKRNLEMIRRWQIKEGMHAKRMEDQRQQRILDQQRKSNEMWETRKRIQKERMEQEAKLMQQEQTNREKSITNRDKLFIEQRERMKVKLDQLKEQARREHEERERTHATRLSQRLAICEYRAWARQRARGGKSSQPYKSLWSLEDTIRRFIIPDILPEIVLDDYKSSSSFLRMLNEAIDQTVDIVVQTVEDDDDFEFQERAREIVHSVIQDICYDQWLGSTAFKSRNVRFTEEELVIETAKTSSLDFSNLKPVSAHLLTPGPSPCYLPIVEQEIEDQKRKKLVENLLNRLLDDLNNGLLSKEHLVKLSTYCMDILGEKDLDKSRGDEARSDSDDSESSDAADDLVRFTIGRILDDIKSGFVSTEDMTDLTLSILNASNQQESTERLDQFIDDTLGSIVKDRELQNESPLNEYMLENFIVTTLHDIAKDVEHGRLPKAMISNMFSFISREIDIYGGGNDLESILQRILEDLDSEKSETLYRVVHTIIASYYYYRDSTTESLSNLVTDIVSRLNSIIDVGVLSDTDVDMNALTQVAVNLSTASMNTTQISQFASDISSALHDNIPASYSPLAKNIVEDVVKEVKTKLQKADGTSLKKIASVVTQSYQNIVKEMLSPDHLAKNQADIDTSLQRVSTFVVKVLKMVKKYLDNGGFTQNDTKEMICILFEMSLENMSTEASFIKAESELSEYINALLSEVEAGNIGSEQLKQLGNDLIAFGQRIVTSTLSRSTSQTISSKPSLTSTAIADDLVTHLISSMEEDLSSGVISSDSLKELAVCILKPTISRETRKPEGVEPDSPLKHPSPCESQLADVVVRCTIDSILKDLAQGVMQPVTVCSIATSVVSMLSPEDEEYRSVILKIVNNLKEDNIDHKQAQQIFSIILDHYKTEKQDKKSTKQFFKKRDSATSNSIHAESFISETLHKIETELCEETDSDSLLAESLIRETLHKIQRDIESGNISDDDMSRLMEHSEDNQNQYRVGTASTEIINFILAILHECLVNIDTGELPTNALMDFLSMIDAELFQPTQKYSLDDIRGRLRLVIRNIKTRGKDSAFVQNIISIFSGKELRAQKRLENKLNKPLDMLQNILRSVQPNILTNFVRITLHSVMSDITHGERGKRETGTTEVEIPFYLMQSTSSIVATNVVRNFISRMESILISGGSLRPDLDFAALRTKPSSEYAVQPVGSWEQTKLMSASSKALGDLILQTLNNIVSNLRLESSIGQLHTEREVQTQHQASAQNVNDFVLEKLQEIIESMQDGILFEYKEIYDDVAHTDEGRTVEKKSSILPMSDREASAFVINVLQDVVQDLAEEASDTTGTAEKQTSTLSLEAENIVIGALQNIIQSFFKPKQEVSSDLDDAEIKRYILNVLEDIKKNISDTDNETVKTAVTRILRSATSDPNNECIVNESESRTFLESTMDFIIENIKQDKIKASDIYNQTVSSSPDSDDIFDDRFDFASESREQNNGRPSLSLQKMSEMTSRMLKLHDDLQKVFELRCDKAIHVQKQSSKPTLQSISDLQEIVTETIKQTINNVVEGKLSEGETAALATALSYETTQLAEDTTGTERKPSTCSSDVLIDDFIVDMLQRALNEIRDAGVDSDVLENVADHLVKRKSDISESCKDIKDSCGSLSSGTSEILTLAVKDLIEKIQNQFSDSRHITEPDVDSSGSSYPRKATSIHATKSVTSESSDVISETSSKGNVNPNAMMKKKPKISIAINDSSTATNIASVPVTRNGSPAATGKAVTALNPVRNYRNKRPQVNGIISKSGTNRKSPVTRSPNNGRKGKDLSISSSKKNLTGNTINCLPSGNSVASFTGSRANGSPTKTAGAVHKRNISYQDIQTKVSPKGSLITNSMNNKMHSSPKNDTFNKTQITLHSKSPKVAIIQSDNASKKEKDSISKVVATPMANRKVTKPIEISKNGRSGSVQEKAQIRKGNSRVDNQRSVSIKGGNTSRRALDREKRGLFINKRNKNNSPKCPRDQLKHGIKQQDNLCEPNNTVTGEKKFVDPLEISSLCGSHKSKMKIRSVNEDCNSDLGSSFQ